MPSDIVTKLRDLADEIERQSLASIKPDMSITAAWNALSGFKEATLDISIARRSWDKEVKIDFEIYDGASRFKSPNLQDCLRKALEAHPANATMEKVEAMFGEKDEEVPFESRAGKAR